MWAEVHPSRVNYWFLKTNMNPVKPLMTMADTMDQLGKKTKHDAILKVYDQFP